MPIFNRERARFERGTTGRNVIAAPGIPYEPDPKELERQAFRAEMEEARSIIEYRKRYLFERKRQRALQEALRSGAISQDDLR